ncbi:hypothetical protein SOVF_071930 [Spinacia oleracea]|nr:hypothetical protein SOVF_071930 [Spinacia oleracea]
MTQKSNCTGRPFVLWPVVCPPAASLRRSTLASLRRSTLASLRHSSSASLRRSSLWPARRPPLLCRRPCSLLRRLPCSLPPYLHTAAVAHSHRCSHSRRSSQPPEQPPTHRPHRFESKRASHFFSELAKNEELVNLIVDGGALPALVMHLQSPPDDSVLKPLEHEV